MVLKEFEKLSPEGTWHIEGVPNKFMDLAKEISRQNIDIVNWLLIAFYRVQEGRNELKAELQRKYKVSSNFCFKK